jgi:hypothetical protein
MNVWSTLALGFTYLSPLVAIYALFGLGLMTGGPGSIFWILIVAAGQMLVALVMGEVVSQFPIASTRRASDSVAHRLGLRLGNARDHRVRC